MRIIFILFSFFLLSNAFSCKQLFTGDINKVHVPVTADGPLATGVAGITDFSNDNDDCTMDCRCVYDNYTGKWKVLMLTTPGKVCLFMEQCNQCKPHTRTCTIRFIYEDVLLQQTFYANDPHKINTNECTQKQGHPVICKSIPMLPTYPGPNYFVTPQ